MNLKKSFQVLQQFSAFLLVGTVFALVWANLNFDAYDAFVNGRLWDPASLKVAMDEGSIFAKIYQWLAYWLAHDPALPDAIAAWNPKDHGGNEAHHFSFHFIVNDLFMVLFFGIAAKEVSESFLPGGPLSSVSKASMPAVATLGGVLGPIAAFFIFKAILNPSPDITVAWAVPTATDIAYCWLFAQIIFGRSHPAVTFLLVLAVLDDLIGMMIIAVFYTETVHFQWLGLVVGAIVLCEIMRRMGVKSFWPYILIGGPMCWFGLHNTGVHAALALVPVIPFMPHGGRDHGLFVRADEAQAHHDEEGEPHDAHAHGHHDDTMNAFEHFFKPIVDVGLLTFGLANAGVVLSGAAFTGAPTWIIFCSLLFGKTIGILFFAVVGTKMGLSLPKPMNLKQVVVLGCVAGIGFTVALFVTTVATGDNLVLKAAGVDGMLKLGALLSFGAGPIALIMSKAMGLKKINTPEELAAAVAEVDAQDAKGAA